MPRHIIEDEVVVFTTYRGDWDASVGTFPSGADTGDLYHVSVAGTVDSVVFAIGDFLISEVASPSTVTYTANWLRMGHNDPEMMRYKGAWDASTTVFPGGGTAELGEVFRVSVSGTADSIVFAAGDLVLALVDNASTATYSNNWQRIPASGTIAASSMEDTDGDTRIRVEATADEDVIRMDAGGAELVTIDLINGLTMKHDVVFDTAAIGPILESPDLTQWRLTVSNAGVITAVSI